MWVGCSEKIALKQVYYQGWNRPPAQVGCMRQVLRAGALGRPRGMGWGGRREEGSGRGTHVNPWLIHVNVWQKPLQYTFFKKRKKRETLSNLCSVRTSKEHELQPCTQASRCRTRDREAQGKWTPTWIHAHQVQMNERKSAAHEGKKTSGLLFFEVQLTFQHQE